MSSSGASRFGILLLLAALIPACGGNGSSSSASMSATGSNPSVSQNGRFVVFETGSQVVVVDRVNATSVVIDGNDVANTDVTPDGRFVAFDDIPSGGGPRQVFLKDQSTGEVTLISATPAGVGGNGDSTNPAVSDNGAVVAFQSKSTDLGARSSSSNSVLVRSVSTTTIRTASSSADSDDVNPTVSGNGNFVAFESRPLGGAGFSSVLLWSAGNGQLSPVSDPSSGVAPDGPSGNPSIDGDGRFVAFESRATNLVGDASPAPVFAGEPNIFVRDLLTNLIIDASVPLVPGTPANGDSHNPSISDDGSQVAFDSIATNLTADVVTPGVSNVFVRDLSTETTTLVTQPAVAETPPPPAVPATGGTVPTTGTGAGLTTGAPVVPTGTGTATGTTTAVVPTGTGTTTGTGTPVVSTGTGTSLNTSPATVPTGNAAGLTTGTPVVSTGTGAGTTPVVTPTGTASGLTTGAPVAPTGTGGASAGTAVPTGTGTTTGTSLPVAPTATGDQGGSTPVVLPGNGTAGTTSGGALVTSTPVTTTGSTSPFGATTPVVSPIAPVTTVAAVAVGSVRPSISADGAWVVFESRGQNLAGSSASSGTRIFIADLRSRSLAEIR